MKRQAFVLVIVVAVLCSCTAILGEPQAFDYLIQPAYTNLGQLREGLVAAQLSSASMSESPKYGYMNTDGQFVIEPRYDWAFDFENGQAIVAAEGKYGVIDKTGAAIIPLHYDEMANPGSSVYAVRVRGKWGLIDWQGRVLLKPQFTYVSYFSEGLLRFNVGGELDCTEDPVIGGKWGFSGIRGVMIKPSYDDAQDFSEGLATVWSKKWGYVNARGVLVIPFKYDVVGPFKEGLAVACMGDKVGFIDKAGRWAIQPSFRYAHDFSEGFAAVWLKKGNWTYINESGKLMSARFDRAYAFQNGLAAVEVDQRMGFIDKSGRMVIDPRYYEVAIGPYFTEGLAAVRFGNDWGFINRKGEVVIPPQFRDADNFENGSARVTLSDGRVGYIKLKESSPRP